MEPSIRPVSGKMFPDQEHANAQEGIDVIYLDDYTWRARIETLAPSEGLRIFLTTAEVFEHFSFETRREDRDRRLYSMTVLDGHTRLDLGGGVVSDLHPKQAALFVSNEMVGVYDLPRQNRLRVAALSISIDRLRRMLGDRLADDLEERMLPPHATRSFTIPVSARLWKLGNSLFGPRVGGPLRLVALEGIALQLFAQYASMLGVVSSTSPFPVSDDKKLIRKARQRLFRNLVAPPSVATLARESGMTERQLNDRFRRVYGTGVHGLLRRERLRYARMLIRDGASSIKEVAYKCGYSHPSNFSTAFRYRYGVRPSSLLKSRGSRRK